MRRSIVRIATLLSLLIGPSLVLLAQPPAAQKSDAQKTDTQKTDAQKTDVAAPQRGAGQPGAGERGAPQRGQRGAGGQRGGGQRGAGGGAARGGGARSATTPTPPFSPGRHDGFLEIAKKGNIDLLFVGDSITDLWPRTGKESWEKNFVPLKVANFGISGDTTNGVLWRMQNGELEGFKAKLIVLMLGTNNLRSAPADQIAEGDRLIVEEFKKKQPDAKILVLGIFPRGAQPNTDDRNKIKEINTTLAKMDDGKKVFYLDIGDKFLTPEGVLTVEVMRDGLHPTAKGYEIWTDAMLPKVKELLK